MAKLQKLSPEVANKRERLTRHSEHHIQAYANNIGLEVSPSDFKFLFGQVTEASTERLIIEESVAVYVSPLQAKALLRMLREHVDSYEELFGAIPVVE